MANKLKMTGFARFFIFLIIVTPLIYSGVSISKGDHPLDALKRDFGVDLRGEQTEQVDDRPADHADAQQQIKELNRTNDFLRDKNEKLEMENERLKEKIEELEGQ